MKYSLSKTTTIFGKVIIKPERSFSFLSYLLQGEKRVLIDTVPERAAAVFLEELRQTVALNDLDAIILNHSEEDHSGALALLLQSIPNVPIYCTPPCQARLRDALPAAHFCPVSSGSTLELGDFRFRFTHTPGLHWDDNMVTYFENQHILFSNDLFGQAIGSEIPLDSALPNEAVLGGAKAYFQQVFSPATAEQKQVVLPLTDLELFQIAPGHGVVLHDAIPQVLEFYKKEGIQ